MSQQKLTMLAPLILDATASTKRIYPRYADVRVDIKAKVRPDVVADDCALPFRSGIFDKIFCDPPHIIGKTLQEEPTMSAWYASQNRKRFPHQHFLNSVGRFGTLPNRAKWLDTLKATNIEFERIIKPSGRLFYKLCESRSHGNFCKLSEPRRHDQLQDYRQEGNRLQVRKE